MIRHGYVPVCERGTLKHGVATGTWPQTTQDAKCKREWRCPDCGDGLHYWGHGNGHMKKAGPYGDIYFTDWTILHLWCFQMPSARRELARLSPEKPVEKTAEAEARLEAFLNPAAAMEKDFEGLTEKDLEELERAALAQVAADRAA